MNSLAITQNDHHSQLELGRPVVQHAKYTLQFGLLRRISLVSSCCGGGMRDKPKERPRQATQFVGGFAFTVGVAARGENWPY